MRYPRRMPGHWTFAIDQQRRLVRITLAGNFTTDDVERMDLARKGAIGSLRGRFNDHLALIDVSACAPSPPDVAAALQAAIGNPVFRARRCAMVVSTGLIKMQARRVVDRPDMLFCATIDEAEARLLEPALKVDH